MPPPHYRQRPAADWDSHHLGDTMESRRLGGAGGSRSRATAFDWDSRHLGGDLMREGRAPARPYDGRDAIYCVRAWASM